MFCFISGGDESALDGGSTVYFLQAVLQQRFCHRLGNIRFICVTVCFSSPQHLFPPAHFSRPCSSLHIPRPTIINPPTRCPQTFVLSSVTLSHLLVIGIHLCSPGCSQTCSQSPSSPQPVLYPPFVHRQFVCFGS